MMDEAQIEGVSQFACVMDSIEPNERQQHIATVRHLFSCVSEMRELPDGYAFRLPDEADMLFEITKFIALEKLCCPFFGFTLEVEPEGGAVWLHLTGREGVKPFIQAEIGEFLSESAALHQILNRRSL